MLASFFIAHLLLGRYPFEIVGRNRREKMTVQGHTKRRRCLYISSGIRPVILPDMLETIWCAEPKDKRGHCARRRRKDL